MASVIAVFFQVLHHTISFQCNSILSPQKTADTGEDNSICISASLLYFQQPPRQLYSHLSPQLKFVFGV